MPPSVKLLFRNLPLHRSSGSWSRWPLCTEVTVVPFFPPTTELFSTPLLGKGVSQWLGASDPMWIQHLCGACLLSLPPSFCPYCVTVSFELCLTLCLCVFSPVVLRVGLCLVWISEDRSRSASAPTLGTVILHVCRASPVPWLLLTAACGHTLPKPGTRALHWSFCPSLKGVFT